MYIGNVASIEKKRIVDETGIHYLLEMFTVMVQTPRRTIMLNVPMNERNASVLGKRKVRKGMPVMIDGEINAFLGIRGELLFMINLAYLQTTNKMKG